MADNWWDNLVVPAGGGKNGLSGAENTELSKARDANQQGRDVFPALANTYRVANRYPGGNPNAVLAKGMLGVGSNEPEYQDYALFKKYALRSAISKAKLLGANPTDKDFQRSYEAGATPEDRFANNQNIIGTDYSNAARRYYDNELKQVFAARYGGLNGRTPGGLSYAEFLAKNIARPEVQRMITPPWLRKPTPGGPAPKASQNAGGWKIERADD